MFCVYSHAPHRRCSRMQSGADAPPQRHWPRLSPAVHDNRCNQSRITICGSIHEARTVDGGSGDDHIGHSPAAMHAPCLPITDAGLSRSQYRHCTRHSQQVVPHELPHSRRIVAALAAHDRSRVDGIARYTMAICCASDEAEDVPPVPAIPTTPTLTCVLGMRACWRRLHLPSLLLECESLHSYLERLSSEICVCANIVSNIASYS